MTSEDLLDAGHPREVPLETVAARAAELGAQIFQVSSKTGENINELFTQVARALVLAVPLYARATLAAAKEAKARAMEQYKQEILASIADINKKNDQGETFLHRYARVGCEELVQMLIDFGADRTIKTARITLTFS